jgi:2-polyprenyl-3-methyl-5-hydroxy-6-metoxy-1,4-benzoquinol methylase
MTKSIFETLERIGVASVDTQEDYASETRDVKPLRVCRDRVSGVIYIDGYYTGDDTYKKGDYRQETVQRAGEPTYEQQADATRRANAFRSYYSGKAIADFGCGLGDFLRLVQPETASCVGIELQQDAVDALRDVGVPCETSIDALVDGSLDALFSFHVLEHLPNPLEILALLKPKLKEGGHAIFEVPHARDFLLDYVDSEPFRKFTLWSQHLVLHTRDSLKRMLEHAGYRDVVVTGVQRYPLSNHMLWMTSGRPGGHKSKFAAIDTPELTAAYEAALAKIDATDTLIAIARK